MNSKQHVRSLQANHRRTIERQKKLALVESNAFGRGMRSTPIGLEMSVEMLAESVGDQQKAERDLASHEMRQALLRGYLRAAGLRGLLESE
jgi:hypothetical protein